VTKRNVKSHLIFKTLGKKKNVNKKWWVSSRDLCSS